MKYSVKVVLAYFKEMGIPEPEVEYKFHPDRKWRFDFCWSIGHSVAHKENWFNHQVALEVQGGLFSGGAHARGAAIHKDHEKRNAAAILGWRILYVTPDELCTVSTANMICEALGVNTVVKTKARI